MPASFFKTMRLLLEFPKREERAEGAIFNPFISKGGKKSASYMEQGHEEPGEQAGSRFRPHTAPHRDSWTSAGRSKDSEDSREASRVMPAGRMESWNLGAGQP